jgi:hypothetical protein
MSRNRPLTSGFVPSNREGGTQDWDAVMTDGKTGRDDVNERLHKAIATLRSNITRVEIWATALFTFSQPVPGYEPDPRFELGQRVKTGPLGQKTGPEAPKQAAGKPSE